MDCSTPGLPVHHQLPELTQTHVHWVGDAIQPPHPLSSPSPPARNPSQHQGLFQWVSSSHPVAKVLEFQLHAMCSLLESGAPHRGNTSGHGGKGMLGDQCWGGRLEGSLAAKVMLRQLVGSTCLRVSRHPQAGDEQGRPWSRSLSGPFGAQWAASFGGEQGWGLGRGWTSGPCRLLGPVGPRFSLHCTYLNKARFSGCRLGLALDRNFPFEGPDFPSVGLWPEDWYLTFRALRLP